MTTRQRVPKIQCPFCLSWDNDVIGGYWNPAEEVYIRRRKCRGCGEELHTDERLQYLA
jgi:transcriptional regulator NrdR family protein